MPTIVFVCTGNMCRSPMAQVLLQQRLSGAGYHGWRVESAGTWTVKGRTATPEAVRVMAARGLDLVAHRSREVSGPLLAGADLVLVMTASQAEALRLEFPREAAKIHLLTELIGRVYDIQDPIGGTVEAYEGCARELERILDAGLTKLYAWIPVPQIQNSENKG